MLTFEIQKSFILKQKIAYKDDRLAVYYLL